MAFTDEELVNLEKWVELDMPKTPGYFDWSFPALLARLEAAEDVIDDIESRQCTTVIDADIAVWKKASGKEPKA